MEATKEFLKERAEHQARRYGAKEGAIDEMCKYAQRLRGIRADLNPYWPGIPCFTCRKHMAVEGSFFCPRC